MVEQVSGRSEPEDISKDSEEKVQQVGRAVEYRTEDGQSPLEAIHQQLVTEIGSELRRVFLESRHSRPKLEFEQHALSQLFDTWRALDQSVERSMGPPVASAESAEFVVRALPDNLPPKIRSLIDEFESSIRARSNEVRTLISQHTPEQLFEDHLGTKPQGAIRQTVVLDTLVWDCDNPADFNELGADRESENLAKGIYFHGIRFFGRDWKLIALSAASSGVDFVTGPTARHEYRHFINYHSWQLPPSVSKDAIAQESVPSERGIRALERELLTGWYRRFQGEILACTENAPTSLELYEALRLITDSDAYDYSQEDLVEAKAQYEVLNREERHFAEWYAALTAQYRRKISGLAEDIAVLAGASPIELKEIEYVLAESKNPFVQRDHRMEDREQYRDTPDQRIAEPSLEDTRSLVRFLTVFPLPSWRRVLGRLTKSTRAMHDFIQDLYDGKYSDIDYELTGAVYEEAREHFSQVLPLPADGLYRVGAVDIIPYLQDAQNELLDPVLLRDETHKQRTELLRTIWDLLITVADEQNAIDEEIDRLSIGPIDIDYAIHLQQSVGEGASSRAVRYLTLTPEEYRLRLEDEWRGLDGGVLVELAALRDRAWKMIRTEHEQIKRLKELADTWPELAAVLA